MSRLVEGRPLDDQELVTRTRNGDASAYAFRPWLLQIVRNEALNRRRGAARRERLSLRVAIDPALGDAAPSPEAAAVGAETSRKLLGLVDDLPLRLRQVIECRFLLGLSERDTAVTLDIAPGTVKSRTNRALERLRNEVAMEDYE
jgi:RNA polymerase sigma-70 factor (ECF subfamily)